MTDDARNPGRKVADSTAGASGGRDHGPIEIVGIQYMQLRNPCPSAIRLLGAVAKCSKETGHEGNHALIIEWSVG